MDQPSPPAQSLLVKTHPGRERPFVLEDLRTGRRREFDSAVHLLDSLRDTLHADTSDSRRETGS
jgi:hypothetical protein